jgi:hypothetical protein
MWFSECGRAVIPMRSRSFWEAHCHKGGLQSTASGSKGHYGNRREGQAQGKYGSSYPHVTRPFAKAHAILYRSSAIAYEFTLKNTLGESRSPPWTIPAGRSPSTSMTPLMQTAPLSGSRSIIRIRTGSFVGKRARNSKVTATRKSSTRYLSFLRFVEA